MTKPTTEPSPRVCLCGCGRRFTPTRPWQRFATQPCRAAYWADVRRHRTDDALEKRLARVEKELGIEPTTPPKGA